MPNSEVRDTLGLLFAQVGFPQPVAVGLMQLHPCWPSDALHLTAVPRGPLPRAALVSPWKEDASHHLWSPWHSRGFRPGTTQSCAGGTCRGHPLKLEPSMPGLTHHGTQGPRQPCGASPAVMCTAAVFGRRRQLKSATWRLVQDGGGAGWEGWGSWRAHHRPSRVGCLGHASRPWGSPGGAPWARGTFPVCCPR